jgi:putative cell wall-binding protein
MVSSDEGGITLVVVSDNFADTAIAQTIIASYPDAVLLVVEWGSFDQDLSSAIAELNPSNVIIVGGPQAVLSEYEDTMAGIPVERLSGEDRSGTSLAVFSMLMEQNKVNSQVKVVNGGDEKKVNQALYLFLNNGKPFVLEQDGELEDELQQLAADGVIVEGEEPGEGDDPGESDPGEGEEESEEELPSDAMLEAAQSAITQASEALQSLTLAITEDCKNSVTVLYANAIKKLAEAEAAFEQGNYGKAYGQANAAYHLASNALRINDTPHNELYVGDLSQKALDWITEVSSRRAMLYEAFMSLEEQPEDIAALFLTVDGYIADAQACYDSGDYECALNNAALAKDVLREINNALGLDADAATSDSANNGNDKDNNGNDKDNNGNDKDNNGNDKDNNGNDKDNNGNKGKP